jgi:hypothetical protein
MNPPVFPDGQACFPATRRLKKILKNHNRTKPANTAAPIPMLLTKAELSIEIL